AFDEKELEILKMQQRESISRRNDDDSEVVFREFQKLIYGADSPYARTMEFDNINSIDRVDLLRFYTYFVHPSRMFVSVIGDFNKEEMIARFKFLFGDWDPMDYSSVFVKPEVPINISKSVNYIPRLEATQSWILLGHMTEFTMDNPDYYPMIIVNQILGGGFNSRIFKRIRTKLGLAYAPGAYYSTNYEIPGVFYVMSQTKTEKTVAAIDALIDEVENMKKLPVTDEELTQAKESYLNSYIFRYEKKSSIVNSMRTLEMFGYPEDFVLKVKEGVQKVTAEDVERVAKKYLHPDQFTYVVLGNADGFEEPLSRYGEVNTLDISIPEPTTNLKEISDEMISQGQVIFSDILSKMGDARKLKSSSFKGIVTQYDGENHRDLEYSVSSIYPDKVVREISMEGIVVKFIFNGENGVQNVMGQSMPLQKEQVKDQFAQSYQNLLWISKYRDEYTPYYDGERVLDGQSFKILGLRHDERDFWLVLDGNNELKGKITIMGDDIEVITWFIQLETTPEGTLQTKDVAYTMDGIKVQESEITEINMNPEIDESIFNLE
ncbi:MAG: insulinase family protein, partial [Candidatus Cloacimonetes bacterium]|nr:insulinase family protein [Candidatus Cloacimonadota bacterium]